MMEAVENLGEYGNSINDTERKTQISVIFVHRGGVHKIACRFHCPEGLSWYRWGVEGGGDGETKLLELKPIGKVMS